MCFAPLAVLSFAIPLDRGDAFIRRPISVEVCPFRRDRGFRSGHARASSKSDPRATERLPTMEAENCQPPAKLPHIVLVFDEFELRCHADAGNQGQSELPAALSLVRRQGAQIAGRGSRWSELVHRIQRADRAVGTLLRAVCRVRYAAFPPDMSSAAWLMRCAVAAIAPSACILFTALFVGARRFHTGVGIEHFFDARDLGGFKKTDFALLRLRPAARSPGSVAAGRCSSLSTPQPITFPWNGRYRPDLLTGLAQPRQSLGRR